MVAKLHYFQSEKYPILILDATNNNNKKKSLFVGAIISIMDYNNKSEMNVPE